MSSYLQEIYEQPQELRNCVEKHRRGNFTDLRKGQQLLKEARTIVFSGMGTSYYASFFMREKLAAHRPIFIEAGELYEYEQAMLGSDVVLILISQSGESIEVCRLLKVLPQGCKVLAITNDTQSTLGKAADCVLELYAGEEKTITNRTYTNTLALLWLLRTKTEELQMTATQLLQAADEMEYFLHNSESGKVVRQAAAALQPAEAIHFIGRGCVSLVSACQAALIFTEGARCTGYGCTTGAFRHGPMERCGPEHRAVVFLQEDQYTEKTRALCRKMASLGTHTIVIGAEIEQQENLTHIPLLGTGTERFAFCAAVAFELLLVNTAGGKGLCAGEFHAAAKVTVED